MEIEQKILSEDFIGGCPGYLSGYEEMSGVSFGVVLNDLERQAEIIAHLFKIQVSFDIDLAYEAWRDLPKGAEKLFLIPQWEKCAETYQEAVQKILTLISQAYSGQFENYYTKSQHKRRFSQSKKTVRLFQALSDECLEQDTMIVPAQFGLKFFGCSPVRAKARMENNEAGLGVFAVGVMLLTHPERLRQFDDLWIDCAGDELVASELQDHPLVPFFGFESGGSICFGLRGVESGFDDFGTASGFTF